MGGPESDRIIVACACGAKLKVAAHAAGRKAKCPKCGEVLRIPLPAERQGRQPARKPDDASPGALGDDLLDDLAAAEQSAEAVEPPEQPAPQTGSSRPAKPCPQCGLPLAGNAVLCTSCGYDLKIGRKTKVAGMGLASAGVATKAALTAGTFVLGCIFSVVGAALGAVLWYVIAMKTGYEIGWIAWGIGGITGFGMALGYRKSGALPGVVAAAIASGSILAAKVLVFFAVIYAAVTGDTTNRDLQCAYVAMHSAEASLRGQGIDPDEATEKQHEAAFDEAYARAEQMSKEELEHQVQMYRAQDEAEAQAAQALAETTGSELPELDEEEDGESVVAIFFMTMFGLFDIVFILLAIGTAYKVGASGLEFSSE